MKYSLSIIFAVLGFLASVSLSFYDTKNSFSFEDGYPSQYLSGSIHYFRVHYTNWRDRLQKLRWAGFHAVQTYVEWASHEPEPGVYDFSGSLDLVNFIQIAEEEGLAVILRPGPYICAERDMGGIPYWILSLEPDVKMRTADEKYMKYVRRWFHVLLPLLKPYMYANGGPIVMVQVENEYGNYGSCDFKYLTELSDLLLDGLGESTFLFTTDNGRMEALQCGKIPSAYATVDFGPDADIDGEFEAQRLINGEGPRINSEFYPGWLDHWGTPHQTKDSQVITTSLDEMLRKNASVNFYVFHGGTNFGLGTGSNLDERFLATPTSYDYDAPVTEAGDLTKKYFDIRTVVEKYFPVPSTPTPANSEKFSYGDIEVTPIASLFDLLPEMNYTESERPKSFEELRLRNGLLVYETVLHKSISSPAVLALDNTHDRGYVYLDQSLCGLVSREEVLYKVPISASTNQTLTIIVESQGRISVGTNFNDFKGIMSVPQINGHDVLGWKMTPIPLLNITNLLESGVRNKIDVPNRSEWHYRSDSHVVEENQLTSMIFYEGNIYIPSNSSHPKDTFLRTDMFTKGYVWINGFLLGRYWPAVGPQYTLYVPNGLLNIGGNSIVLLELEDAPLNPPFKVTLVDKPDIDGAVPYR